MTDTYDPPRWVAEERARAGPRYPPRWVAKERAQAGPRSAGRSRLADDGASSGRCQRRLSEDSGAVIDDHRLSGCQPTQGLVEDHLKDVVGAAHLGAHGLAVRTHLNLRRHPLPRGDVIGEPHGL